MMTSSSVTSSVTSSIPWNSDRIVFSLFGRLEISKYHVTVLSPFLVTRLLCVTSQKVDDITYQNLDTEHEQYFPLIGIVPQFQIDRKCFLSVRINWPKIVVVSLKILSTIILFVTIFVVKWRWRNFMSTFRTGDVLTYTQIVRECGRRLSQGLSPIFFGDVLVWNYVFLAWDYLAVLMLY